MLPPCKTFDGGSICRRTVEVYTGTCINDFTAARTTKATAIPRISHLCLYRMRQYSKRLRPKIPTLPLCSPYRAEPTVGVAQGRDRLSNWDELPRCYYLGVARSFMGPIPCQLYWQGMQSHNVANAAKPARGRIFSMALYPDFTVEVSATMMSPACTGGSGARPA